MGRELRRIDVLLNQETGKRFDEGDIVKITTIGNSKREYIGRIHWLETSELTLDTSKEYKNWTIKLKYDDIYEIEKVDL